MAASQALFSQLAEALGRPSKAYRAAQAGLEIPESGLEGYTGGLEAGNKINALKAAPMIAQMQAQEMRLKPYEIYSKISDAAGPDVANSIFQKQGIPIPDMSGGAGGTDYSKFGERKLSMDKTQQDMANTAPYSPDEVRGQLASNPDMAEALIKAYPGGKIPSRALQNAISTIRPNIMQATQGQRTAQSLMNELPANSPSSAGGIAYGVKIAARQGKALVANPGSAQRIALGAGDIARAVLRAAPQLDAIKGADYSQNLVTKWSALTQRLSANPKGPDAPLIRKDMYGILDELDKTSTPWIQNKLSDIEDTYGSQGLLPPAWNNIKSRQMAENIPDVPFNDGSGAASAGNPNVSTGVPQGMVHIRDSQGGEHYLPKGAFGNAKQRDPGLQVIQ